MNPLFPTVQALLSIQAITDIVEQRIEPIVAPEGGELPDIVVNTLTNDDTYTLDGPGRYYEGRVRIECRARDTATAIGLGDLVVLYLDGLSGVYADMNVTSFIKQSLDETDHAEDFSTYRRFMDFNVRFRSA